MSSVDLELISLMPLVCAGCRTSFARLYGLTAARLFGVVLRINSVRPEAEEVLQETYAKFWNDRARFDGAKGKLMFWLIGMARCGAIDSLRRRRARPAVGSATEATDASDCYAGFMSATPGPLESAMLKQSADAVQNMLVSLPDAQRQSLALAFYEGLSHSEIAQRLGRPLGTVKSSLRRALAKMRPALAEHR